MLHKSIVVKNYWLAVLWNVVIIILSLLPSGEFDGVKFDFIPHLDKVVHFIMYALLTFLILHGNRKIFKREKRNISLILTVLYAFFLGFFLELLQNSFIIGRIFDIFDVLANTCGIIIATVFFRMFNH